MTRTQTRKPGDFHAVCKRATWQPLNDVLRLPREEQPDTVRTRWDHKLRCEVALVPCNLDTTDRTVYEQHIAGVHTGTDTFRHRRTWGPRPWSPPKLTEDGTPFKDRDGRTEACPKCGLVSEVPINNAGELWWREHLELCTGEISERGAA